jgi:hypothetical protein
MSAVRRIAGCVSPSAAILVDDQGERLVCAYNDPALDADRRGLPLDAWRNATRCSPIVRWPEGAAAAFAAAARHGILTVFDGDCGTSRRVARAGRAGDLRLFSQPGLVHATGFLVPSRVWPRSPMPSPGS